MEAWQEDYENGKKAFDENDYDTAVQCLERMVEAKGGFADVYNILGVIYSEHGRHADAVEVLKKSLDINPAYMEASLNLSVVYNEMGELEKAQEAYSKAKAAERKEEAGEVESLDPFVKGRIANMHAELAAIYKNVGYYFEACGELRKALELRPEFADLKTELGIVYREMRDMHKSVKELKESLEMNPHFPATRIQLGLTYYVMGKKDDAREMWEAALEKNPNDKMARMYLNTLDKEKG